MHTEIYEADPFTSRKSASIMTIDTDYRFEKGDEFVVEKDGHSTAWRIVKVRVVISGTNLRREVAALRI